MQNAQSGCSSEYFTYKDLQRKYTTSPIQYIKYTITINLQIVSYYSLFKGKWQQKFLSAYLKETPKQYIEVYYRIFISALFGEIFDLKFLGVRHLGYLQICMIRHNWGHAIFFSYDTMINLLQ